jgi:hypothetical protein
MRDFIVHNTLFLGSNAGIVDPALSKFRIDIGEDYCELARYYGWAASLLEAEMSDSHTL